MSASTDGGSGEYEVPDLRRGRTCLRVSAVLGSSPVSPDAERSADDAGDPLDDVVAHALVVPWCPERLHVAGGVGGPAGEFMLARGGIPVERPAAPCEFANGGFQR